MTDNHGRKPQEVINTTYRIKLKDGNKEIEIEGEKPSWVAKTFEKLRKKYLLYYNEDDKEKLL